MMSSALTRLAHRHHELDTAGARAARLEVRRLRARLALSAGRFDRDWVWLVRRELRVLEQVIGDVVDADGLGCWVAAQRLDQRDEAGKAELLAELAAERARAHRRLVALVESARYERMVQDLRRPYLAPRHLDERVGKQWRALRRLVRTIDCVPGDEQRRQLAVRIDRARHGAELEPAGRRFAEALAKLRLALDGLQEAALAQGWLRHAADGAACRVDLVAGQLLERARQLEAERWIGWQDRWDRARRPALRAWLEH